VVKVAVDIETAIFFEMYKGLNFCSHWTELLVGNISNKMVDCRSRLSPPKRIILPLWIGVSIQINIEQYLFKMCKYECVKMREKRWSCPGRTADNDGRLRRRNWHRENDLFWNHHAVWHDSLAWPIQITSCPDLKQLTIDQKPTLSFHQR